MLYKAKDRVFGFCGVWGQVRGGLALKKLTEKKTHNIVVRNCKHKIILMGEYTFHLQWWDHMESSENTANWTLTDTILSPRWNAVLLPHPKSFSSVHSDTNEVCWPKPSPPAPKGNACFSSPSTEVEKMIKWCQCSNAYGKLQICSHGKDDSNKYKNQTKGKLRSLRFSVFSVLVI